jgi:hypothetical protein
VAQVKAKAGTKWTVPLVSTRVVSFGFEATLVQELCAKRNLAAEFTEMTV